MDPTQLPAWGALAAHRASMEGRHLRQLFREDPGRFERFSLRCNDLFLDYSKNRITQETMGLLLDLAEQGRVRDWIERMFAGEPINVTERRAALHVALRNRSERPMAVEGEDVMPAVRKVLAQMRELCGALQAGTWKGYHGQPITDVVNIGIGGSDLGPAMVTQALTPYHHPRLRTHFISNVDGAQIADTLRGLHPGTTLFVVVSKTFTTQETLKNARTARSWMLRAIPEVGLNKHFVAVSANAEEVRAFGIDPRHMLAFWDWVGGRYSLWSAAGLSIALAVGMEHFEELLQGAHDMDEHFRNAPLGTNMPVILALLGVWYNNFWGAETCAVLPYDQHLARLPAYLQQLDMESNGKGVTRDGEPVRWSTGPILWGEPGTNGQHAFFQLLHQSPRLIPVDFLVPAQGQDPYPDHHRLLVASSLAQAEALMRGKTQQEVSDELEAAGIDPITAQRQLPHRVFPGNRPSNTLLFRRLTPRTLGGLVALYEHKVFVQGVLWGINSFDQWGVELGKQLARAIAGELEAGTTGEHDASTEGLMVHWRSLGEAGAAGKS
jgi:glucose-6-phosphate isomerase